MIPSDYRTNRISSDKIAVDSLKLGKAWTCPQCSEVLERVIINKADEGRFPEDYDYTIYESDADFMLTIIEHVTTHLTWG